MFHFRHNIRIFFVLSCLFIHVKLSAFQPEVFKNFVYSENIKTVLIHRKGWQLSPPIINIANNDQLKVSFDDLGDDLSNYYYTIYQCNSDWRMSEMVQQDYLVGFYENPITGYEYSTNTTIPYTHYNFTIPNEDVQIKLSGNYALVVYRDFNPEDIVFVRRFYVYEPLVTVNAQAKRPVSAQQFDKGQQIDISIDHEGYEIRNPYDEIKMVVLQNLDWNMKITDLKPTYIRNNELVYDYNDQNIFQGNSEFRYFDIKSLRYQSEYIRSIEYDHQYHHIYLVPGEERHYGKYFYNEDINGNFLVDIQEFDDPEISADYVKVYFSLKYNQPIMGGEAFVYGALTDWQANELSKMNYNTETNAYEANILIKQGYYNYAYAVKLDDKQDIDLSYIEGSHYETENDYFIFVYHRPFHLRYDRLIGMQVVNSVRKGSE